MSAGVGAHPISAAAATAVRIAATPFSSRPVSRCQPTPQPLALPCLVRRRLRVIYISRDISSRLRLVLNSTVLRVRHSMPRPDLCMRDHLDRHKPGHLDRYISAPWAAIGGTARP